MSTKPAVLFVHGAWQGPKHYESVTQLFEQNGFAVFCPQLPTVGGPPSMKMYDDAKVIRAALDNMIERQDMEVIVIGHAYGGIVMTEAVHESLGKRQRAEKGLKGGVVKLVYVCGFMPPLGKSLVSSIGNTFPAYTTIKVSDSKDTIGASAALLEGPVRSKHLLTCHLAQETGQLTIQDPAHHFYNDVSVSTQQYYISLLGTHPATAQLTPTTYAAFEHHPVTYLFCKEDQAFPYEWQQKMVEGSGVAVESVTCDAGHSPFISQMESVLGLVQ